jgi:hypothetical protein
MSSPSQPPTSSASPGPGPSPAASWAPHFGARFQLERLAVDELTASYAATVHLPDGPRRFSLLIRVPTGEVVLSPEGQDTDGAAAPEWTTRHLTSLARQLYRGARRDEGWPRRLMRWHAAEDQAAERGRAMSAAARAPGTGEP